MNPASCVIGSSAPLSCFRASSKFLGTTSWLLSNLPKSVVGSSVMGRVSARKSR